MNRVLVVDDNEESLYYLTVLMRAQGYVVDSARNGVEALEKAHKAPPLLVMSDLLMPVMDGYTLLRHWKADPVLKQAPFIVYTATYTDPEDERLARHLGADAFILKPSEPAALLACVAAVLSSERVVPADASPAANDENVMLREYSEALVRRLEHKSLQLEASNRDLLRDIAAREHAELALRESEERFRQLAESIEDVFWLSDVQQRVFYYVSPAYEVVWGRPSESLYADPASWIDTIHAEDRPHVLALLARHEPGATGFWDATYRIVRADQSVRWVRSRAYPVRDAQGNVYRLAGVSRDISEYRRLEEQFRHTQKMEAVGRLAAGVAHDFNNLLSVILSYASMISSDLGSTHALHGDIEEVCAAAERAAGLTHQLLAFSRQQVMNPQVQDLSETVLATEKMLRRLLGEDIELTLLVAEHAGKVHADRSQLEQVIVNLVVNARDAMPRGGKLSIEVKSVELDAEYAARIPAVSPGPHVMLAVTDTGLGMDAATRERIFEPFFTTKEIGKGTGLGLSTVFGIVQQSQGHIHVYSEPGVGTTFRIYFARTDRALEPVGRPAPVLVQRRGTETVLLVEDDEHVRATSRTILQRNGYHVLDCASGEAAIATSEQYAQQVDLLLTDVVMPRMSGRELAARLAIGRPAMKVLFVSGYTADTIVQHGALEAGLAFMEKPIIPDALLRKVREVLEGAR